MSFIPPTTEGWTSQKFGTNPGGYNPTGGHTGEDIAVPVGTPLVAMADGVVVHVGYFTGKYSDNPWWIMPSFAGFVVTVDYGEYLSHYAHCSGSPVLSGRRVRQGDVVAYSGNTGSATSGPHCHWEVMRNGWNLQSSTYGRINPRDITGSAAIAPQGDTTQEDDLTPEQATQLQTVFDRIKYLDAPTSAIPEKVWSQTVFRGGQQISVKQELADAKSEAQALRAVVGALSKNSSLTAEQISAAVKAGLADGVTVDVNVNGGK